MEIGSAHLSSWSQDVGKFLSRKQFKFTSKDGLWLVEHVPGASNASYLDGKRIVGPTPIRDGQVIAVGNADGTVIKFPIRLRVVRS